jgi:uncharacterized membrane protein YkoI
MYRNYQGPVVRQRISIQQAQEIALRRIPGRVIHVNMDMENGVLVYEIFILDSQNRLFEVEVHSRTGQILKIEEENDLD